MDMLPLIFLWLGGFAAGAAAGYVFYIIRTGSSDDDDADLDDPDLSPTEAFDSCFDKRDTRE